MLEDRIFVTMKIEKIAREKTALFSDLANKLVYGQEELSSFLGTPFSLEAFEKQMQDKKENYTNANRGVLAQVLETNYSNSNTSDFQKRNVEALKRENTFTVTTGHQLSLFTGPLYFVIKILHVVQLAESLSKKYPHAYFVPIFWMASEDHDFEEINQVNLFNNKLQWNANQSGAVGRFDMQNWEDFRDELRALFNNHPDGEVMQMIEDYHGATLAESTFNLVNALFKEYGVLVLDGDQKELKQLFAPIVKDELLNQRASKAVSKSNEELSKAGHAPQAHAREINLFLFANQKRIRIQKTDTGYHCDGIGNFSEEELISMLNDKPEQFSPNVILRPVYQECILPNLCYVGGGGEMAYWLQLKGVFEAYKTSYPLIQVRNSLLVIDHATNGKIEPLNWNTEQLFQDVELLKKEYVFENTEELDFTDLRQKRDDLIEASTVIVQKVDPNMQGFVAAEMTRLTKQMENLEQKLLRAEKSKFEKSLKQMDQIKEKLFPNGGLQERSVNFFQLCSDGQVFKHLESIKNAIDPWEKDFIVCYF